MTMRARASELPVIFSEVAIVAGEVPILDGISLVFLAASAPTVLIGPNGAGKTTLLRAAMGLIPVSRGRITWGGRDKAAPERLAILFQRPVMLRRSASDNLHYALAAANVPRDQRASRCCSPPDKRRAGRRSSPSRPTKASSSAARWLRAARGTPAAASA